MKVDFKSSLKATDYLSLVVVLIFALSTEASPLDNSTSLQVAESNLNHSMVQVLIDLRKEIAKKHQKNLEPVPVDLEEDETEDYEEEEDYADDDDETVTSKPVKKKRTKMERRNRRRKMKKKCLALSRRFKGDQVQMQRRIWKQMFRCFWNWMASSKKNRKSDNGNGNTKLRKKQERRRLRAEAKQKEREKEMSDAVKERNKLLLKETFKRLNGFYKPKDSLGGSQET